MFILRENLAGWCVQGFYDYIYEMAIDYPFGQRVIV